MARDLTEPSRFKLRCATLIPHIREAMVRTATAGDPVYGRSPDDGEVIDHALATTYVSCEPDNAVVNREVLLEALALAFGEPPTRSRGEASAGPQDSNGPLRDFIDRVLDPYFKPLPLGGSRRLPVAVDSGRQQFTDHEE